MITNKSFERVGQRTPAPQLGVISEVKMGYFDGLTASSFKTDEKGNTIYYPWGIFGTGYILPEDKKDNFRKKIKRHMMVFVPLSIILTVLLKIWAVFALPLYFLGYWIWIKKNIEGLAISSAKLTLKDTTTNSARAHNFGTLWLLEISALLFVAAGIIILVYRPQKWIAGLSSIVFFGWCAYIFWKMIRAKKSQEV